MNSYSCCKTLSIGAKKVSILSVLLRLVSEENRLKLICILRTGEHCVCEMMEHVDLSQSLVSHHLKDLKKVDIVTDEKRGLRVYYTLTDKGKNIADLLFTIPEIVDFARSIKEGKSSSVKHLSKDLGEALEVKLL